jgi:signal transduction histidine kinase/DNA-binding response OmpR family regulator
MHPHGISWEGTRSYVAIPFLPRDQRGVSVWRWATLAIVVQALVATAAIVSMYAIPGIDRATQRLHQFVCSAINVEMDRAVTTGIIAVLLASLMTAVIVVPLVCLRFRRWTRGLGHLQSAIRRLAQGAEPKPASLCGDAGIDYLLVNFNDMAARLLASRRELIAVNRGLEQRVAERTKQLSEATRLAERASEAKSRFLAQMSHEIRTPLNGVIGTLSLLDGTRLDKKQCRLVRIGRIAASALLNLINDILDFSSIEAGQFELATQPFAPQDVIEEAVTIAAPLANRKQIDITYRVDPAARNTYSGDPARLRQVLLNLINNAIKFTDSGSVDIRVTPSAGDGTTLQFEVHDTGIGIPEHAMDRLFRDFSQAGNDETHARGGTGLGLAICKQLVEKMGGSIGVESKQNEGSSFRFTIQTPRIDAVPAEAAPLRTPRTVLVLEESSALTGMVEYGLGSSGYEVVTVADRDALIDALADSGDRQPTCVLLGRTGNGSSPRDTLKAIMPNRAANGPAIPILLLVTPEEEEALATPYDDDTTVRVLHRPLLLSALLEAIDGDASSDVATHSPQGEAASAGVPPSLTILVAEDNPVNQFIVTQMLDGLGVRSDVVDDGDAAIEAITRRRYDLVLMDQMMPGTDGLTAAKRVRELEASGDLAGHLPIVALTANVLLRDSDALRDAGVDGYLAKPIDAAQLKQVILNMIEKQHPSPVGDGGQPHNRPENARGQASGFDIDNLRSLCNNNPARLEALLGLMDEHYRAFNEELRAINEKTPPDRVKQLGHKIAGCAYQARLAPLGDAARRLEHAPAGEWAEAVAQLARLIDDCLEHVIQHAVSVGSPCSAAST